MLKKKKKKKKKERKRKEDEDPTHLKQTTIKPIRFSAVDFCSTLYKDRNISKRTRHLLPQQLPTLVVSEVEIKH